MTKVAATHAQGQKSADRAFELNARANEAAAKLGKDKVINATVGSILDEQGNMVLLPTIEKIYRNLAVADIASYAPIKGLPKFCQAIEAVTFRNSKPDAYTAVVGTAGGTGALHHAIWNYSEIGDTVISSDWYWGAYKSLAENALRKYDTFEFYTEQKAFNVAAYEAKINEVLGRQESILVILNTPAHNPTGYSLSDSEWDAALEVLKQKATTGKRIALMVDVAYIDFAGDSEECRKFMTKFGGLPSNLVVMFGVSMSKSFTFYGQRTGAIIGVSSDKEAIDEFESAMEVNSRATWSNINRSAMKTMETVFEDKALFNAVEEERKVYKELVEKRSAIFVDEAAAIGLEILPYCGGFFVSIPTTDSTAVIDKLMEKEIYGLPLPKGVRIATCAIPVVQMKGLAKAVQDAIYATR
jgi:Aspartate/tyrosine/aromatic aminotransferase